MSAFAVIFVNALVAKLIIPFNGCDKVVNWDVQLLSQFFEGIRFLQIAECKMGILPFGHVFPCHIIVAVRFSTVVKIEEAAAADFFKLLAIFLVVGIKDITIRVVRLHVHAVQHEFIGAGLVAEPFTVEVDLQEGLFAEPEPFAVGLVSRCFRRQAGTPVEHHGRMAGIHLAACPEDCLDPRAIRLGTHRNVDLHLHGHGLEG